MATAEQKVINLKRLDEYDEKIKEYINEETAEKVYTIYVRPSEEAASETERFWQPFSTSKFKVRIPSAEINFSKPYVDDAIVFNSNGTAEKTILETLELLNGDLVIYSNLAIDCKIILRGE